GRGGGGGEVGDRTEGGGGGKKFSGVSFFSPPLCSPSHCSCFGARSPSHCSCWGSPCLPLRPRHAAAATAPSHTILKVDDQRTTKSRIGCSGDPSPPSPPAVAKAHTASQNATKLLGRELDAWVSILGRHELL